MPIGDIVQKAFYLGVGIANYAAEKAGDTLQELRIQAQKLADEMVTRGEMTTEEARKYVDDLVQQAQVKPTSDKSSQEPRVIEILSEEEDSSQKDPENLEPLRKQVEFLQDELRRLKRD
jgi:polyhydroxyalkanoate synthesis regulator phasin